MTVLARVPEPPSVLDRLTKLCPDGPQAPLALRLQSLSELVRADLAEIEAGHPDPAERPNPNAVERAGLHLLAHPGKRLRAMCVCLAARLGSGFDTSVRDVAVAVELIHAATLMHDDVVDHAETRRGAVAARQLLGNAVSIFAGDWLLIEALRRVRRSGVSGIFDRLLDCIEEMIMAESVQLERRGVLETSADDWRQIAEGKTAALFRWALFAGGTVGGLEPTVCADLERFGCHLGIAFQAVDDLLDLSGDPRVTGKAVFADLHDGKLTYPVIIALERDPALRPVLRAALLDLEDSAGWTRVQTALASTGALGDAKSLAEEHAAQAKDIVAQLNPSPARDALLTVVDATLNRAR